MHNFVYLAQWRSQEFSCEPNFEGGRASAHRSTAATACGGFAAERAAGTVQQAPALSSN